MEATIRTRLGPENRDLDGEYVARRMLITESPEYRSAWQQVMSEPHPLLTDGEIRALRAYRELRAVPWARSPRQREATAYRR